MFVDERIDVTEVVMGMVNTRVFIWTMRYVRSGTFSDGDSLWNL